MKVKSKYLISLILLLVICGCLTTYALFRSNKSGNATVNTARWNVVFKNGETKISDNFNISLNNAEWTNELGNVASGKIAPGSSATFYITIDASNTETSVDYTAEIDESFDESDFEVTLAQDSGTIPYSTTNGAMIRQIPIRVIWNGNINDNDDKNSNDLLKRARNITIPIKLTAAQKLALKYTVTFNDGVGNVISSKKVNEGDSVGTLPENPTRYGYTFAGWYDDITNGNEVTSTTLVTPGMVIYAHWNIKYLTITFNSNGGSSVSQVQVQEGESINSLPSTTKTGYSLNGWYDNNYNELSTSTIISEAKTYNASWKQNIALGAIEYFDPVSTNLCNDLTFNLSNINNGTSTCYKWRVIDTNVNNDNINIQMDHNLIGTVAWNSKGNSVDGPVTILTELASETSSWKRVSNLNYTYNTSASVKNYGTLNCINGTCTISKTSQQITNVKARIITGEEVANITKTQTSGNTFADTWTQATSDQFYFSRTDYVIGTQNTTGTGNTSLSWLIENTVPKETNFSNATASVYGDNAYGYWTLTPADDKESDTHDYIAHHAYVVNRLGNLGINGYGVSNSEYHGARPVITVPKTDLN